MQATHNQTLLSLALADGEKHWMWIVLKDEILKLYLTDNQILVNGKTMSLYESVHGIDRSWSGNPVTRYFRIGFLYEAIESRRETIDWLRCSRCLVLCFIPIWVQRSCFWTQRILECLKSIKSRQGLIPVLWIGKTKCYPHNRLRLVSIRRN